MHANQSVRQLLHCGGCGPFPSSSRCKAPVDGDLTPVHGATTVISLPHACLTAGLLEDVRGENAVSWVVLSELVKHKWRGSADRFLKDAAKVGFSPESEKLRLRTLRGAIIGWTLTNGRRTSVGDNHFGICSDLELAVVILSRTIGEIFISERPADYSWDTLFAKAFECDEDLGPVPKLNQAPWCQYKWGAGN